MSSKFQRTKEDFKCANCGCEVKGDGYTNHCPECLWSKHVDVYPGDREEECQGMMEPVNLIREGKGISIIHQCLECGEERKNKISKKDKAGDFLKRLTR